VRWSAEVEAYLRAAGWSPGRRVGIERWVKELRSEGYPVHEAALAFLSEFGGLEIDASGPGRTQARSHVKIDPTLAFGERDRLTTYFPQLGGSLVPVGELDHGHALLALDENGAAFLVMDFAKRLGRSGDEALTNLIEGHRFDDRIFEISLSDSDRAQGT
jgi:SUKH-3 immunity protein